MNDTTAIIKATIKAASRAIATTITITTIKMKTSRQKKKRKINSRAVLVHNGVPVEGTKQEPQEDTTDGKPVALHLFKEDSTHGFRRGKIFINIVEVEGHIVKVRCSLDKGAVTQILS